MKYKTIIIVSILLLMGLSACSAQEKENVETNNALAVSDKNEFPEKETGDNNGNEVDPLRKAEELLQGTWEYFVSSTGFKEILTFDNGKVIQDLTVKEYDYRGSSEGTYEVRKDYIVVLLNGRNEIFNYSTREDKISLSFTPSNGMDEGETRKYHQTSKGILSNDTAYNVTAIPENNTSNGSDNQQSIDNQGSSVGEKNALAKALQYLEFTAFSHDGLVEQLEYEGFSQSEAQYGADNCGADWKEQAAKKAKDYLSYTAFSYNGLIEQLEYEGFTNAEAQYGADNCGANWKEQAVEKARQYLEYSSFSRSELIDQLVYEGFTQEQAEYGVNKAY